VIKTSALTRVVLDTETFCFIGPLVCLQD